VRPVYQTRTDDVTANCLPACLATLFEDSIEAWDRGSACYADWEEWIDRELARRGLAQVEIVFGPDVEIRGLAVGGLYILTHNRSGTLGAEAHAIIGRFAGYAEGHVMWNVVFDPWEPYYVDGSDISERDYLIESVTVIHPVFA